MQNKRGLCPLKTRVEENWVVQNMVAFQSNIFIKGNVKFRQLTQCWVSPKSQDTSTQFRAQALQEFLCEILVSEEVWHAAIFRFPGCVFCWTQHTGVSSVVRGQYLYSILMGGARECFGDFPLVSILRSVITSCYDNRSHKYATLRLHCQNKLKACVLKWVLV